ncbi:MAG TPA: transposase [Terriglobales bacterium]|nr:transposase [Terriglobales bacterium]
MSIPIRNADRSHVIANERTFFVTSSTWGKTGLLQSARAASLLIDVLYNYRKQRKYLLHEFVIMPDHFHVLITADAEMTVEKAVQLIKGGFAFRAGRELGFRAPVWQKGFSEIRVNDSEALLRVREYIHPNPVKRFLVTAARDYAHSSARSEFELDPPPPRLKALPEGAAFGIAKAMPSYESHFHYSLRDPKSTRTGFSASNDLEPFDLPRAKV